MRVVVVRNPRVVSVLPPDNVLAFASFEAVDVVLEVRVAPREIDEDAVGSDSPLHPDQSFSEALGSIPDVERVQGPN